MNEQRPIEQIRLPSVDKVLRTEISAVAAARFGRDAATNAIRRTLAQLRQIARGGVAPLADAAAIATEASRLLEREDTPSLRRVFNLTGTVLHTNLGRAVLPEPAIAAAVDAMRSAVALEFDIGGAARGERDDHVRGLIRELTGAEDACVVNNNAAAVLLVLNTFGAGKEAIVSRGELIEIGGSFRLPDIMARAGARLVEVGTTNRTHLRDYEQAIGDSTGLILKAHTSNYLIQGFTKAVPAPELAALARARGVPFVHDLGSGALVDLARYGLEPEPTVREALSRGRRPRHVLGRQAARAARRPASSPARRELVARVAKNPMKRALRLDKIRLAALEAVLKLYRDPDRLPQMLPTLRYFARSRSETRCAPPRAFRRPSRRPWAPAIAVSVVECTSQIGSGALPLETLPSAGLAIRPLERKGAGSRLGGLGCRVPQSARSGHRPRQ